MKMWKGAVGGSYVVTATALDGADEVEEGWRSGEESEGNGGRPSAALASRSMATTLGRASLQDVMGGSIGIVCEAAGEPLEEAGSMVSEV